jgi:RNA polymerase sigma-70 factor (ECF subfamily)
MPNPVLVDGGASAEMSGIPEPIPVSYSGMTEETRRQARFTDLVKRHSVFVFRVAFAVLRNAPDAEEVVQETFLKLYRSDALDRMQDERAFLARTAWRVAQDRRPRTVSVVFGDDIAASSPSPEDVAIDGDLNSSLHRLIDSLPDHLRQPLALSAIQEMTSPGDRPGDGNRRRYRANAASACAADPARETGSSYGKHSQVRK